MTGIVLTSANSRLKGSLNIGETLDGENNTQVASGDTDTVRGNMKALIDIAENGEELSNLRTNIANIELFETFINYCLIHFTTSMNWRYKACESLISDIFTESDEALCILLIENNASDYGKMQREQRKIGRKESKPKYTKVDSIQKRFKGWSKKAIKRFNLIVKDIKKYRDTSTSRDMECELRLRYRRLSGLQDDNDDKDDSNTDSEESDSDSLDAYDGFAGEVTNVTEV